MGIIDTHTHLYVPEFDDDRQAVVERAQAAGIQALCMPNIDSDSIQPMLRMCAQYPGYCYPMLGLHPTEVHDDYVAILQQMHPLLQQHPFIAIGEVGLDFYWDSTYKTQQIAAFDAQIQWALSADLPLVIHSRAAFPELCQALEPYRHTPLRGIFHSFTGTADEAQALLQYSHFMLGINGVATFKKSTVPEALTGVPLSRVVVETDSPYLAPTPYRGKRNESAYIVKVVEKLADVYQCTPEHIAAVTADNAHTMFRI